MTVELCEECEYTTVVADFIETLARMKKFKLEIWLGGGELPLILDQHCDFLFLQEGFRFIADNIIGWVFYDTIVYVRIKHENK